MPTDIAAGLVLFASVVVFVLCLWGVGKLNLKLAGLSVIAGPALLVFAIHLATA